MMMAGRSEGKKGMEHVLVWMIQQMTFAAGYVT